MVPPLSHKARGWRSVLAAVAGTAQVLVVALTFLSVMFWPGSLWLVGVAVALVGLVVLIVLGTRSGRTVALVAMVAVPFISVAAVAGLGHLDQRRAAEAACSDRALQAVRGLRAPSGRELVFEGAYDGCAARVQSSEPTEQLTLELVKTLRADGWDIIEPEGGRVAQRDGVTLFVEPLTERSTGLLVFVDDVQH